MCSMNSIQSEFIRVNYVIMGGTQKISCPKESLQKADRVGIKTARLPIQEHRELPEGMNFDIKDS